MANPTYLTRLTPFSWAWEFAARCVFDLLAVRNPTNLHLARREISTRASSIS